MCLFKHDLRSERIPASRPRKMWKVLTHLMQGPYFVCKTPWAPGVTQRAHRIPRLTNDTCGINVFSTRRAAQLYAKEEGGDVYPVNVWGVCVFGRGQTAIHTVHGGRVQYARIPKPVARKTKGKTRKAR